MTHYAIIKKEELSKIDFKELNQTNSSTSQWNLEKTKLVISFDSLPRNFDKIVFEEIEGERFLSNKEMSSYLVSSIEWAKSIDFILKEK